MSFWISATIDGNVIGRVRRPLGDFDVERLRVLEECLAEDRGEFLQRQILLARAADRLVVDVGELHDVIDLIAEMFQRAAQQIDRDVGAEIADVPVIVDGRPADVERDALAGGMRAARAARPRASSCCKAGTSAGAWANPASVTQATAMAAIPSPRPAKPSFSFVVALRLTRSGRNAERRAELGLHLLEMRRDLRRFGDDRGVDVLQHRAALFEQQPDLLEENEAAHAAPAFVGVRENDGRCRPRRARRARHRPARG